LDEAQDRNDALLATQTLKRAFTTDVSPVLAEVRMRRGGALEPVQAFRASGYRDRKASERPAVQASGGGIV
jgi:L-rhamnose isomerase/sugar isomerase